MLSTGAESSLKSSEMSELGLNSNWESTQIAIRFADFLIDFRRRGLYRGALRIRLTSKPFMVLVVLVQNRGAIVSKEELLRIVWKERRDDNTVEQAIRKIRRALGEDKQQPRFVLTIPGEGYVFIADTWETNAAVGGASAVEA